MGTHYRYLSRNDIYVDSANRSLQKTLVVLLVSHRCRGNPATLMARKEAKTEGSRARRLWTLGFWHEDSIAPIETRRFNFPAAQITHSHLWIFGSSDPRIYSGRTE